MGNIPFKLDQVNILLSFKLINIFLSHIDEEFLTENGTQPCWGSWKTFREVQNWWNIVKQNSLFCIYKEKRVEKF